MKAKHLLFVSAFVIMLAVSFYSCDKDDNVGGKANVPVLSTVEISNITSTAAFSGGNITEDHGYTVTARGVCWSTGSNPTIADSKTNDGTGAGSFSSSITGLSPNTTYYVRAYATSNAGTGYGSAMSFNTIEEGSDNINYGSGVSDIDGNNYITVIIGSQEWMAENLKVTKYRNGVDVENPLTPISWQNNTNGGYVWYYGNDEYKNLYGGLYNWYAVNNSNGLCPAGWRVPSRDDWDILKDYLISDHGLSNGPGVDSSIGNALKSCRQNSSPLGGSCNTTEHPRWNSHSTHFGSDLFGFGCLPGGWRDIVTDAGGYKALGIYGYWWSSSQHNDASAWGFNLGNNSSAIMHGDYNKSYGCSVRCIKN